MKRKLPPMNSLVVFDQAAQNKCFKHAADKIGISKSAVSKQISKLETTLDVSLFQRYKSGNELTQAGLAYSDLISRALDIIEFATESTIKKTDQIILTCETPVTFGEWWLTPALVSYRDRYPNVIPKLITRDSPTRTENKKHDLSVICHQESSSSPEFEPLFDENLVLVASRDYMHNHKLVNLNDHNELLILIGRCERQHVIENLLAGLTNLNLDNFSYVEYQHFYMVKSAIENGMGVGLIPEYLCREDLEKGSLVNVMSYQCQSGFTYSLQVKEHKRMCKKNQQFMNWLKQTTTTL